MTALRVLVVANVEPHHLDQIRSVDPRIEVEQTTDHAKVLALAKDTEVILGWRVPPEAVRDSLRLRWIHASSAGVDGVLHPEVIEKDVIVTSSSGIHAEPMSEHVLGVILAFSRRLHLAVRNQMARHWDRRRLTGDELGGRTLGILGLGAIGTAIAGRARAFGMHVIGTKRAAMPVSGVDEVYAPDGLDEVLRRSDYLVITLPLTPETEGLIGPRELGLMKPTAYLINVARGTIVQEEALIAALQAGRLAGAGLDVFEKEPLPAASPLYDMEQVILTPHVSGTTPRYFDRVIPLFVENLRRYLQGQPLLNVVDKEKGY